MHCRHHKSIFVLVLFLSVCIESCIGKGGAKKDFNNPGGPGTEEAINDYSDVLTDFTDNPQGEINHKKLKSTNTSKSSHKSHGRFLIGAFNMQKLGLKKIKSQPDLLNNIVKIVKRYDLLAISEITDRKEAAIKELMERVNQKKKHEYHYKISPRVGRTKNKEQYAIIYRAQKVQIKSHTLYDDSSEDIFTREPLIAEISFKGRDGVFGLVIIHTEPTDAVKEINALVDVHDWIENNLKIKDVIIIGDLNADCNYVRKKDWPSINLRNQDKFLWLIGDDVDTTVTERSNCAYDRIVISGDLLQSSVIPKSAKRFKFDRALRLEEYQALQVSEHYPVEFAIILNETVTTSKSGGFSTAKYTTLQNVPIYIPTPPLIFYLLSVFGIIPAFWHNPLW